MRNPFRYLNSSPEVIRLTVMMYVRYPLSFRQFGGWFALDWHHRLLRWTRHCATSPEWGTSSGWG